MCPIRFSGLLSPLLQGEVGIFRSVCGLIKRITSELLISASNYKWLEDKKLKDEKNWYRCTTREEMVKLVVAGFNYTNFRKDRFNDGNFTYYFERTKELEDYLASTARV